MKEEGMGPGRVERGREGEADQRGERKVEGEDESSPSPSPNHIQSIQANTLSCRDQYIHCWRTSSVYRAIKIIARLAVNVG